MKKICLLFTVMLVLQMPSLKAASIGDDFDPTLKGLFVQLTEGDPHELLGKDYTATLTLQIASNDFLMFSDASVNSEGGMNYQFAKWEFSPEQVASFASKRGSEVKVKFMVTGVEVKAPYETMPHIIATIESIK